MENTVFPAHRNKIAVFLIMLLAAAAYINSLSNSFVLDDASVIINNDFIKSWKNFPAIFTRSYITPFKNGLVDHSAGSQETSYRPVVTISYFIDYSFWKLNPFGYHLTNLLLHAFNAVLLYYFASLLMKDNKTGLFSSLLFAVHPVNTEAVNVISFREDLLVFLFFVSLLILYAKIDKYSGKKKITVYVSALGLFLLALFSKETAVIIPLIIILYDWLFCREQAGKSLFSRFRLRYLGFFCAFLFYIWVRFFIMKNLTEPPVGYPGGGFYTNILTMCGVVAAYIKWAFWPFNIHYMLSNDPALIIHSLSDPRFLNSIILIILCFVAAVRAGNNLKEVTFSFFWFFITLIPVLNIWPITNYIAVRYLYVPMAGFCFLAPVALTKLNTAKFLSGHLSRFRSGLSNILIFILAVFFIFTIKTNNIWKNGVNLSWDMVRHYPDSAMAYKNLGLWLFNSGQIDAAIVETKKSLKLRPRDAEARRILGQCYYSKNMLKESIFEFSESLKLEPNSADVFNGLGIVYALMGNFQEARKMWLKALEINPEDKSAKSNLKEIGRLE